MELSWWEAGLLGVLQGLTEFLPVSSSGHLTIGGTLIGLKGSDNLLFAVLVHCATVLSTLVVFWRDIWSLLKGLFQFRWNEETQYVAKIVVSMIPVGIVGLFFKDSVEALFGEGLALVGFMLILTACLLLFSYYYKPQPQEGISFRNALIVGVAQTLAVMPGLSRSGSTIATGLVLGIKKESIAKFSFLMVIAPVLGETLLSILGGDFSATTSSISIEAMVVGFVAAFVSGLLACRWMISIVQKGKLVYFAIYCLVMGSGAILYSLM